MRAELARHMARPFAWGASDCSLFADVVRAMTGFDPIAGIRGYKSEAGALRKLRAAGYETTLALIENLFPEIPPDQACRGDLGYPAVIPHPLMSPAVIAGSEAFSKAPGVGAVIVPRRMIVRAFAV